MKTNYLYYFTNRHFFDEKKSPGEKCCNLTDFGWKKRVAELVRGRNDQYHHFRASLNISPKMATLQRLRYQVCVSWYELVGRDQCQNTPHFHASEVADHCGGKKLLLVFLQQNIVNTIMPPKKKNKNKPNGFYMYMLEKKHEFEAQEGRNLSMNDLVPLAHPGWKVGEIFTCFQAILLLSLLKQIRRWSHKLYKI